MKNQTPFATTVSVNFIITLESNSHAMLTKTHTHALLN